LQYCSKGKPKPAAAKFRKEFQKKFLSNPSADNFFFRGLFDFLIATFLFVTK
jgi:hypothetical protein